MSIPLFQQYDPESIRSRCWLAAAEPEPRPAGAFHAGLLRDSFRREVIFGPWNTAFEERALVTSCVSSSESSTQPQALQEPNFKNQARCTTCCAEFRDAAAAQEKLQDDLRVVVASWPRLSEQMRAGILAIVKSATVPNGARSMTDLNAAS